MSVHRLRLGGQQRPAPASGTAAASTAFSPGPGPKANGSFINVDCSAGTGNTLRATLFGSSMASDVDFTPWANASVQQAAKVTAGFGLPGMYARINTNDTSMDGSGNPNLTYVDRVSAAMPNIIDLATGSFSYNLGGRGASASQFAQGAAQIAKRFIANGTPCKGFEIFNENDGLDIKTFVPIFNATADALHAIDPGIEIIGVNDSWMRGDRVAALGSQSVGKIARYHYHSYSVDSTVGDADAFGKALSRFGGDAAALRSTVAQTAGATIPAGLGEYNLCGNPPGDLRQTNVKGAVFTALGLYAAFAADPLTTHGAYWDWFGNGYYGIVIDPSNNPAKLPALSVMPAGYVLKNCRQYMAGSVVGVTAPFTNVKALATVNGTRVSLWVINYNLSTAYTGQVAFNAWPTNGSGNGTATVLEVSGANPGSKTYTASVSAGIVSSITVPPLSSVVVTAG